MTKVMCSWCHTMVALDGDLAGRCPACGHDAGVPRIDCRCGQCQGDGSDRQEEAEE